jgi:hypothetical protein
MAAIETRRKEISRRQRSNMHGGLHRFGASTADFQDEPTDKITMNDE